MKYLLSRSIALLLMGAMCMSIGPSCKKYLAPSPNKSLVTITSVSDLQGLMDYYPIMNEDCTEAGEASADNYFLSNANFAALPYLGAQDLYLWEPGAFDAESPSEWQNEYSIVYYANVVLDNIGAIARTTLNASDWDNCKGEALVFRAKSFLEIAAIWAKGYDSSTASTTLGIPLRLTSDFNTPSTRATVAQTYQQIIADLRAAIPLLPNFPVTVFRPSKDAAYGLMAKTYLAMADYADARVYADSCLQLNSSLVDFNTLVPGNPFGTLQYNNPELIMFTQSTLGFGNLYLAFARVDTNLYQSYAANDLRQSIYYTQGPDGYYYFSASYTGSIFDFNGLATDEVFLIRAEAEARGGDVGDALSDLNTLLSKRWKTGTFVPFTAPTADSAISLILTERRKELMNRGTRWTDIKRFNLAGANISLTRVINGQTYTLPPNDPRFALSIPILVIQTSGIQQN